MEMKLKEAPTLTGFVEHPHFYNIYCHPDGRIYNLNNGFMHQAKPTDNGYRSIAVAILDPLTGSLKTYRETYHKVILSCFKKPDETLLNDGYDKLMINHIDGNKWNNAVDNLEWVSSKQNSSHAYINGLRDDNINVSIWHINSGRIHQFNSLAEAARYIEVSPASLTLYLKATKKNPNMVFKGVYQIREKDVPFTKNRNEFVFAPITIEGQNYIVRQNDGKLYRFYGKKRLERKTGVSSYIVNKLLETNPEKDGFYHYKDVCFIPENMFLNEENETIHEEIVIRTGRVSKPPKRLKVTHLKTGDIKYYLNSEILANQVGLKRKTFQRYIHRNDGYFNNEWKVEYLEPDNQEGIAETIKI